MAISRRSFLAGLLAAPLLPVAAEAVLAAPAAAAGAGLGLTSALDMVGALQPRASFGYSTNGGEWWTSGFASHAEAVAEARQYVEVGSAFETGLVHARSLRVPNNFAESISNALCDSTTGLAEELVCSLQSANEDSDYEGEFSDMCAMAPLGDLPDKVRLVTCEALVRAGRPDWSILVMMSQPLPEEANGSDPSLEVLSNDEQLSRQLAVLIAAWAEEHGLEGKLKTVDVTESQEHIGASDPDLDGTSVPVTMHALLEPATV